MSEENKKIMGSLKSAVEALPEGKREYLRGYAEAVNTMARIYGAPRPQENGRHPRLFFNFFFRSLS